jgi:hypothetical protein
VPKLKAEGEFREHESMNGFLANLLGSHSTKCQTRLVAEI